MPTSKTRQAARLDCQRQRKVLNRVRERMAELPGMSVEELMRRSNLTRSAFYNYEQCKRPLDMETVREFERVLYLPAGELFKLAGWLPASLEDFAREPGAVLKAIEVDPDLSKAEKRMFRQMYESFKRGDGGPRRRPRPST